MRDNGKTTSRRLMLGTLSGMAGLGAAGGFMSAACAASLGKLTPSQAEGPFYPTRIPADHDGNLLVSGSRRQRAAGTPLHLGGTVRTTNGRPLTGVRVEIWQCDAKGIYNHPLQPGVEDFDTGFQGFGAVNVDGKGRYAFLTLVPVPYPGRPPHIHVKLIRGRALLLTTQLYLKGNPHNQRDRLRARLASSARDALNLTLRPAQLPDGLHGQAANFDFVV